MTPRLIGWDPETKLYFRWLDLSDRILPVLARYEWRKRNRASENRRLSWSARKTFHILRQKNCVSHPHQLHRWDVNWRIIIKTRISFDSNMSHITHSPALGSKQHWTGHATCRCLVHFNKRLDRTQNQYIIGSSK